MAKRNRVIYQNELLMVSPSATGNQNLNGDGRPGESLLRQIKRVQSINYGFAVNRTDAYQYGQLARIDSPALNPPTVSLDFSYYLTDGKNEHLLGFDNTDSSNFLHKNFLNDGEGKNYYVYTGPEGRDAVGTIAQIEAQSDDSKSVIAIGNGFLTNYSVNAAIGGMPTATVSVEGANITADAGKGGTNPAVDPTNGTQYTNEYQVPNEYIVTGGGPSCLLPGDIEVGLGDASLLSAVTDDNTTTASHIQSVAIDLPLSRTTLNRVGSAFGYAKVLDVPIKATVSVSAILADKKSSSKSLFTELFAQNKTDLTVALREPSSAGSRQGNKKVAFTFHNAVLESENYAMSIGDNRTVDYVFSTTVGDPSAASVAGSSAGSVQMVSSGVYELLQVIETGVSTDTSNQRSNDIGYGTAIAANDEILVVGASGFNYLGNDYEKGAAYIYKNKKSMYTQAQLVSGGSSEQHASVSNADYLPEASDTTDNKFGFDVAVSPQNLIAIGQDGYGTPPSQKEKSIISIYHPNTDSTSWTIQDIMTGLKDGGNTTILWGNSMAFDKELSGTTQWLVAGAPLAGSGANEMGNVHVRYGTKGEVNSFVGYPLDMTNTEVAGATVHDANERFGTSVAMHGNLIVAGAPGYSAQSGVAYVYAADGTGPHTAASSWVEVAKLTGATSTANSESFGYAVDIHGTTIVVGQPSGMVGVARAGAVHVLDSAGSAYRKWTHSVELTTDNAGAGDRFGKSVSMPNSSTIVVGAPNEDSVKTNAGSVYVFTGGGSSWAQTQKITYSGVAENDYYGYYNSSLAATQKEIFVAGNPGVGNPEKAIRYRI